MHNFCGALSTSYYWYCSHSMRQVYVMVRCPSVCLSVSLPHLLTAAVVCPVDRRYRSIVMHCLQLWLNTGHSCKQYHVVGSWTQTCLGWSLSYRSSLSCLWYLAVYSADILAIQWLELLLLNLLKIPTVFFSLSSKFVFWIPGTFALDVVKCSWEVEERWWEWKRGRSKHLSWSVLATGCCAGGQQHAASNSGLTRRISASEETAQQSNVFSVL